MSRSGVCRRAQRGDPIEHRHPRIAGVLAPARAQALERGEQGREGAGVGGGIERRRRGQHHLISARAQCPDVYAVRLVARGGGEPGDGGFLHVPIDVRREAEQQRSIPHDGGGTGRVDPGLHPFRAGHRRELRERGGGIQPREGQQRVRGGLPPMIRRTARDRCGDETSQRGRGRRRIGAPAPERVDRGKGDVPLAVARELQDRRAVGRPLAQARRRDCLRADDRARIPHGALDEHCAERRRQTRRCP